MFISLCAHAPGLFIRGSDILLKWLWLESGVIDCDSGRVESLCEKRYSSRVESPFSSTRLESESPIIMTRVESLTRVTSSLTLSCLVSFFVCIWFLCLCCALLLFMKCYVRFFQVSMSVSLKHSRMAGMLQLDQVIARSSAVPLLRKWSFLKCSECFECYFLWPLNCQIATKQCNALAIRCATW